MCEEKNERVGLLVISHIGSILAAIPALGFAFAASKEVSFFYFLGVDIGQVLDTSDLIRSSALSVLPAIPVLFVSLFFFASTSLKAYPSKNGKISLITSNRVYYFMLSIITLSAFLFLFLGIAPETSAWSLAILIFIIIVHETVRLLKPIGLSFRVYAVCMTLLLVIGNFAVSGALLAFRVRSGDLASFPIFKDTNLDAFSSNQLRVIRHFSDGLLLVDYQDKVIIYIPDSQSSSFEYALETEPFRGLLCYVADWCWASGWVGQSKTFNATKD